jgi:hypothetical protein
MDDTGIVGPGVGYAQTCGGAALAGTAPTTAPANQLEGLTVPEATPDLPDQNTRVQDLLADLLGERYGPTWLLEAERHGTTALAVLQDELGPLRRPA